VWLTLATLI